jgi:CubicO group peptidase (beta-lactamase class C family)
MAAALPLRLVLLSLPALFAVFAAAQQYNFTSVASIVATDTTVPNLFLSVRRVSDGAVLFEASKGTFTRTTVAVVASASKWVSAMTIMRLVERDGPSIGLALNSTVGGVLGGAFSADGGDGRSDITLGELLSFTSGLATSGRNDAVDSCVGDRNFTLITCAQRIFAANPGFPNAPRGTYVYGSNHLVVAGAMAERASGLAWNDIFKAETLSPLGLTQALLRNRFTPAANPNLAGSLFTHVDDYAAILGAYARTGAYFTDTARMRSLMEKDWTPQPANPIQYSPFSAFNLGAHYGLGVFVFFVFLLFFLLLSVSREYFSSLRPVSPPSRKSPAVTFSVYLLLL